MGFLQFLSRVLAKYTSIFIIGIAVVTYFEPRLFQWVTPRMSLGFLGAIMLTMGLTLTLQDFRILAKRPLDIFIGACAQFTIMPLLAWGLVKILHLDPALAVGLILVGCCPGGVTSNLMSFLCRGDVAFSVGMTTASTLLAPVLTPLLMLKLSGRNVDVDAWGMFQSILIVTIIPVALGLAANLFWGKKAKFKEVCQLMPGLSVIAFMLIIGNVVSVKGGGFFSSGMVILLAIFLHNLLGYLTGYLTGIAFRMGVPQRRTLSLEVGMQNAGMATALALNHFPAMPDAALAAAASCVWHSISGALAAGFFLYLDKFRRAPAPEKLPDRVPDQAA